MDKIAVEALLFSPDFGEDQYLLASSTSSESDSECCCTEDSESEGSLKQQKPKQRKVEGFAEISVPLFDDGDFKNSFRVSRATCDKVIELIHDDFTSDHKGGWEKIVPTKAAYVLLWYLGTKETFKQISRRFGITQSCVHNIVRTGCRRLSSKQSEFIKWPDRDQYEKESKVFHRTSKIFGIIGVVAVSHVKILRPREDSKKYVNKKRYHSIAVQGIVGSKRNFIDIYVSEGSLESYEILEKSSIMSKTDAMDSYFLVGSNAYPSLQWLVTPFPSAKLASTQEEFNRYLNRTCSLVSDAFGKLKERFQRLNHLENRDVPFIVHCIESACVIHNICINNNDGCELFEKDDGIFDCEFEFEGEDGQTRMKAFHTFLES